MNFGWALGVLKAGGLVTRDAWGNRADFLYLVPGSEFKVNRPPLLGIFPEGRSIKYREHIDLRSADGTCTPWVASHRDLLADDWRSVA